MSGAMTRNFLIALSLTALFMSLSLSLARPSEARAATLDESLKPYGVSLPLAAGFTVAKDLRRKGTKKSFHTLIAEKGDTRIELEITLPFDPEEAEQQGRLKRNTLISLYGAQYTPYPGEVTNLTSCPENMKPKVSKHPILGQPVEVIVANATERYTFGVWEKSLVKRTAAVTLAYEPRSKALFHIRVFQPYSKFTASQAIGILKSLRTL